MICPWVGQFTLGIVLWATKHWTIYPGKIHPGYTLLLTIDLEIKTRVNCPWVGQFTLGIVLWAIKYGVNCVWVEQFTPGILMWARVPDSTAEDSTAEDSTAGLYLATTLRRRFSQNADFTVQSWINVVGQNWLFESYLPDFKKEAFLAVAEVFPGIATFICRSDWITTWRVWVWCRSTRMIQTSVSEWYGPYSLLLTSNLPSSPSPVSTQFLQDELPILANFVNNYIILFEFWGTLK